MSSTSEGAGILERAGRLGAVGLLLALPVTACAKQGMVLDLQAAVMYEKPEILEIAYEIQDSRRDGGVVVVSVRLRGDAGLDASFDITPGIVDHEPMRETEDGSYIGRFSFPPDVVGGPFSIVGRLWHEKAGEMVLRDPRPLSIPLIR